jgi:anti-sigma B factor antagonist
MQTHNDCQWLLSQPRILGWLCPACHRLRLRSWGVLMAGTQLAVMIALPAEIDMANADRISGQITAALARSPGTVIADMTATTFCDSIGIRVLVLAHRQAAANGTELRLLQPSPRVLRVMELLGVDAVLPVYHRLDEALTGPGATEAGSWGMA